MRKSHILDVRLKNRRNLRLIQASGFKLGVRGSKLYLNGKWVDLESKIITVMIDYKVVMDNIKEDM
jgi:hypothetical protein